MADNVQITAGAGTAIATDEVAVNGGAVAQVQYVKLVDGSSNGVDGVPGTTQGLAIINRRDMKRIALNSAGLTIVATAYTAGDQVGNQFALTNAVRAIGGTGTIVSVVLTSAADIINAYDVVFFRTSVTLAADNAAFSISDADALHVVGIAQLAGAWDIGLNRVAQALGIAIPYDCSTDTSLYAALICRGDHTIFGAVTDLQLQVFVERN